MTIRDDISDPDWQPLANNVRTKPPENTVFVVIDVRDKQGAIFVHESGTDDIIKRVPRCLVDLNLMVNLRSGGTPDLTKEYTLHERNPETPEVHQGDNQKPVALGAFKIDTMDESNNSNIEYEDLVEDTKMSDNNLRKASTAEPANVEEQLEPLVEIVSIVNNL
ncbi:predicted protein [Histoplasma capsulatum G186AR]|uniref:Uncharacterized protein n=1 Tax=Ajellomyces capsulatus (strain G186AR / H82 / ATCC MYA-2454 / RMSCC 2432) TaxID=447093 RepID=C0NPU1_AJECG|nr:uncharacterized protein HCBG_05171 [Histoplasma capsulatum G186AR]EEH06951.1 predicted protein [Histoplasma capsulatum G186AR]